MTKKPFLHYSLLIDPKRAKGFCALSLEQGFTQEEYDEDLKKHIALFREVKLMVLVDPDANPSDLPKFKDKRIVDCSIFQDIDKFDAFVSTREKQLQTEMDRRFSEGRMKAAYRRGQGAKKPKRPYFL